MYIAILTIGMCASYLALLHLFPLFFGQKMPRVGAQTLLSIPLVAVASLIIFLLAYSIPDPQLSNRVLHAFGGGFLSFWLCFFAMRNSGTLIIRFQFIVFSILVVTTLGVCNEILEFILHRYAGFVFSMDPLDTWLDLVSNTVGLTIAAILVWPFLTRRHRVGGVV